MPFLKTLEVETIGITILKDKKIKPALKYHELRKAVWEKQASTPEDKEAWRGGMPKGRVFFTPKPVLLWGDSWSFHNNVDARIILSMMLRMSGITEASLKHVYFNIWYQTPTEDRLDFRLDGQEILQGKGKTIYRAV
jgi:hypothetical protein